MATTDARSGFRLPWSSEQDSAADGNPTPDEAGAETAPDATAAAPEAETSGAAASEATGAAPADGASTTPAPGAEEPALRKAVAGRTGAGRTSSKFMADLTRAMQAAAESAREQTLEQLRAEAAACVEAVREQSTSGASELRRSADDDVAAIRDWSKEEMSRIRAETDRRIAERKERLEREIEEHGARIERRVEAVHGRVAGFETEMATFFEHLRSIEDPAQFASLAGNLPEPPPLEVDDELDEQATDDDQGDGADEGAMSSDLMAARLAGIGMADPAPESERADGADFAAAEAEALAGVDEADALADEAIAARLSLVAPPAPGAAATAPASTQVVVTGLVSVASIAGFKRHLARLDGVQGVTVSSGPEGEFVFKVNHLDRADLAGTIPDLPGFGARVTGTADGTIEVTARDPDPEA